MSTALTTSERTQFDALTNITAGYLYVYEPPVVFEASIIVSDPNTITSIVTDTITTGSFSDIKEGMTLELEDGSGNFRGRQRVRGTSDPIILTGRAPRGNVDGALNPGDATTVKVYDEYRVWAKIPYISPQGVQLRDQQEYPGADEAQPPLTNNAFPALLVYSNDGTARSASFDASLSRALRGGPSITYSWDFEDGTILTGTATSVDPVVEFPVGDRYVSLTVTDNNGVSDTMRILISVVEDGDLLPARIARRSRAINRNDFALDIPADLLSTSIRDGVPVLFADNEGIGDFSTRFYGWLGEVSSRYDDPVNGVAFVTLTCDDITKRLRSLVSFPQVVKVAEDATGSWQFLPDVDIRVLIHHMWRWYSTALEVATLDIGSAVYSLPRLETKGNTLFDQFDKLAQAIAARVSVDMTGVIRIIPDPAVQPTAAQKSTFSLPFERDVTVRTTLTENDYANPTFTYTYVPRVSWSRASAIVAATTKEDLRVVKCVSPSKTPGQGTTENSDTEQLVDNTVGQDELNVRTGNRYASRQDNPFGMLQIELAKSGNIFDPALMQVFEIQLPDTLKNRHGISDTDLWLLNSVDETYDPENGTRRTSATFERLVEGEPAETVANIPPPESVDGVDETALEAFTDGALADLFADDPVYNLDGLNANIVMFLGDGTFAVTSNADDPNQNVNWTVNDHSGTIGMDVRAWCLDSSATAVSGWLVTGNGVYYVEDAQNASPTFTNQLSPAGAEFYSIDADFLLAPGDIVAVCGSADGTTTAPVVYISTDGGSNWTSDTDYGPRVPSSIVVSSVDPGVGFVGVDDGTFESRIRQTNDYFGTNTAVITNIVLNNDPPMAIAVDRDNVLFYSDEDVVYRYNITTGVSTSLASPAAARAGAATETKRFSISVDPNNANNVAFVAATGSDMYVCHDAMSSAPTWYAIDRDVRRCALVNGGENLYGFGPLGNIVYVADTYSDNDGVNLRGDLSTSAAVMGIAGY